MKKIFVLLLICSAALTAQTPQQKVFPPTAEQRAQIDAKLADLTARLNSLETQPDKQMIPSEWAARNSRSMRGR